MCFIGDKIQLLLKTLERITPNENKTLPIGTIQTVKQAFDELHLRPVLDHFKHCGHSLSNLVMGLVSYKLTEDLSVINCHKWMNNNPLLMQELADLMPEGDRKKELQKQIKKVTHRCDLGYIPKKDFPKHLQKYYLTKNETRI